MDYAAHTLFPFERAYKIVQRRADELMPHYTGCSRREIWVLVSIQNNSRSQRKLSEILGLHPNVLVKLIDGLEARGLLVRTRRHNDRREHILQLTAKGERCLEQYTHHRVEALRQVFSPLTDAQIQQWRELSRAIVRAAPGALMEE